MTIMTMMRVRRQHCFVTSVTTVCDSICGIAVGVETVLTKFKN